MVKIVFHTEQLDVRGTCKALFDYAHYNEILLGNESYILTKFKNPKSDSIAVEKFENRFKIIYYRDTSTHDDIQNLLTGYDIIYSIKYGKNDGFLFKNIKNVIHYVFDATEPHGEVFAAVSETLADKFGKDLFVPHMISLKPSETKDNFRKNMNIPDNAIVFGRHGGLDTFNLQIAFSAIKRVVSSYKNIYFVFVNTPVFHVHSQIIYCDKIITDEDKNKFISTCDAHLECSNLGHTFGISIGEFSVNNKPIIAYNGWVWNRCHLDILGDKGIYFQTEDELYKILTNFNPEEYKNQDLNCYKEYNPENVMNKFKKVFID